MEEDQFSERGMNSEYIPLLFSVHGVKINEKTEEGETMLHTAVKLKDKPFVSILLKAGGDVNVTDSEGNTPLSSAIEAASSDIVDLLLKYNPDFDIEVVRNKFYASLLCTNERIVKSMINHGFTVKENDQLHSSLLWAAVLLGLDEFAISMINLEKDLIESVKIWYRSFLLMNQPFTENQAEMLKTIIKIKDHFIQGQNVITSSNHNLELFKILLSSSDTELVNVNVISLIGSFNDNLDIVSVTKDILLTCYDGENPILDEKGRTGLHLAAKVGNVVVIEALLDMHLDIDIADEDGKTPLDYVHDRINEIFNGEISNEALDDKKHYDEEFNCEFCLLDLKIGAVLLVKHVSKLITSNLYISLRNLQIVKSLLLLMSENIRMAPYYLSICSFIEHCEDEINIMKNTKLVGLTYFDFLKKNFNQIAPYTKRKEVIEVFHLNNDIVKELEIYGPMLQRKFQISNIRRDLIDNAERILFDIFKYKELPLVVIREILSNLSNNQLTFIVLNT